jgi:hypothetical protein
VILLALEGPATFYFDAISEADEWRLRSWAARAGRRVLSEVAGELEEAA